MSNLETIRKAIATTLQSVPNLRVYEYVPDAPQPPCVVIIPETIQYQQIFNGASAYQFILQTMTAAVNNSAGQTELDELIANDGERSIPAAFRARPTLDGSVQLCDLKEMRNYGTIGDAVRYYSAQLIVDVWAE